MRTRIMRYADALRGGPPTLTGVVEGACRDRTEPTCAFGSVHGAEAVLRLRALWDSGDFDEYWHFHAREKARNYADGHVPDPLPGQKHHLTRVK